MIAGLCAALEERLTPAAATWLEGALRATSADPAAVHDLFPVVARQCGRGPLDAVPGDDGERVTADWSVADAARVLVLTVLPSSPPPLADRLTRLYREGGTWERLAVLRGLAVLDDLDTTFADSATDLLNEALRSQDPRLLAAAVGPYAARHLDAAAYRHAILKCVFTGVPALPAAHRADAELARMLADHAHERVAAGRDVSDDVWPVLARFPDVVAASGLAGEADHPDAVRRTAARRALDRLASVRAITH
ncbi:EboA domain-containing protein [Streptomyces sp. SID10853]|uniref:EboA domain-containing protein n=1 Tax=Streptomyces sp. SID10853 TaxID=2706028 RepID=UPI001944840F|nr:EboA domain-containing protein [Streptomyces sp. SID10853]